MGVDAATRSSKDKPVSSEPKIEVVDERQVDFYGDTILAILLRMDGETVVVVPVRPICQVLAVDWSSQRKRINRDEVLKTCVVKITTQVPGDTQRREHLCLPIEYLHGWLFGITTSQVSEAYRERITLYRRECFRALSAAFQGDLALPEPAAPAGGSSLAGVRDLALAVAQMAEQQMALEGRVEETHEIATQAHGRLDKAAEVIGALQRRTHKLEDKLHPHAYVTEEQAAHVSTVVKALAELLTQQKGKNQYQSVFSELYRRFGVPSYKHIRQEQYADVLTFLDDWRDAAMKGQEQQEGTADE
jgi:hypothetical protein